MRTRATLTFMSGPRDGETVVVSGEGNPPHVRFGRLSSNQICLPADPEVSRNHARIVWRDGGTWLEDLVSANGTFLDEFAKERKLQEPVALAESSIFRVGRTRFRVEPDDYEGLLAFAVVARHA